jgi:multidrug resistance efflux pump
VRLTFSRLVRSRRLRAAAATVAARAGRTRIPCDGRVGARRLRPGRYAVAITAIDAAGRASRTTVLRFRIVD